MEAGVVRSGRLRQSALTPRTHATNPRKRKGHGEAIPQDVRVEVGARSQGMCEVRGEGCTHRGEHLHHRRRRSQGGEHTAANLVHACSWCHGWVHNHPAESYERGWLVHGWDAS